MKPFDRKVAVLDVLAIDEAARYGVWYWSKIHKSLRPQHRRV